MFKRIRALAGIVRPVYVEDCLGEHKTRSLARVGSIAMAKQLSEMGLKLISTIVLSRLLPPSTFGLLAMVVFFRELMRIFGAAGFVEAAVQKKSLTLNQLNGVFWLNAGACTVLAVIFIACGPLISSFYNEPELTSVCLVYGLLFILENLFLTHAALLRRTMNSELLFVLSVFPQLVGLIVSITMAIYGFEIWALVGGGVFSAIVSRLLYLFFVRWTPSHFKKESEFREMSRYGFRSSCATVVNYVSQYSQTLALGRIASAADVGFYNRGQALFQMPIQQVSWPIAQLMLPALSALQNDRKKMLDLILRATWLVVLISVPFTLFMVVYGDVAVVWLIGDQWAISGVVTQWLAIASVPVLISNLLARGNAAIGRPGRGVLINIISLPILLYGIYIYAEAGAVSVAKFYALYRWTMHCISIAYHLKGSGFDIKLFVRSQLQLLLLIGLASGVLLFGRYTFFSEQEGDPQVLIALFAGVLTYLLFFFGYRQFELGRNVLNWLYLKFLHKLRIPKQFIV